MRKSRLFLNKDRAVERLLEDQKIQIGTYTDKEEIYAGENYQRCLGFLLRGRADVYQDSGRVVLNHLGVGSIFGAAALFSTNERYVTRIIAQGRCTAALIAQRDLEEVFFSDFEIARRYMAFLSEKIIFLNEKLDVLTGHNIEGKIAAQLLEGQENGIYHVTGSMSRLARTLDISRASLYRVLEDMQRRGILQRREKEIHIYDTDRLMAMI